MTRPRDTHGEAHPLALDAVGSQLDHCVHCGFCLPACPTYTRLGDEADSPRGRLHLMGAVSEGRLDPGSSAFQLHLDRCLGCRACETVCPSGVEYGNLLERARAVAREARPADWGTRLLLGLVERPIPFRIWMALSRVLRRTGLPRLLARVLPSRGLAGQARFGMAMLTASEPAFPNGLGAGTTQPADSTRPETLPRREEGPGEAPPGATPGSSPGNGTRVGVLTGCVQDGLFHRVNQATIRVLEANGFQVVQVPGQGCCGALHAHAGALDRAREMARRNIAAFEAAGVEEVAVNAAGCGAAMKEYGELLADDTRWKGRARALGARVLDISQVLAGEDRTPRSGAQLEVRVAYDPPCHLLHAQRVVTPPLRLLEAIPRLEVAEVRDGGECCGGAGIYGLTHPELGGRIGRDKAEAVRETGASLVTTGNPGCAMQIGAMLRLDGRGVDGVPRVCHPIELLDESYRRAGFYGLRSRIGTRGGRS
jgi:glycolate oxidase iron-sulfur subunit